jgi:hypothetical protein
VNASSVSKTGTTEREPSFDDFERRRAPLPERALDDFEVPAARLD